MGHGIWVSIKYHLDPDVSDSLLPRPWLDGNNPVVKVDHGSYVSELDKFILGGSVEFPIALGIQLDSKYEKIGRIHPTAITERHGVFEVCFDKVKDVAPVNDGDFEKILEMEKHKD